MFAATGNTVVALHRDRIGGLDLPGDLSPGDYRPLTDGELISAMSGGLNQTSTTLSGR
jgi:16S rRNA pseudouridine516 synthase